MSDKPIGLGEAIRRVRAELMDARQEGEGKELRFRLDEVTLDFQVEVTREGGAENRHQHLGVSFGGLGRA